MEHYVYIIKNVKTNKAYIGTRSAKVAKDDLGIKYFSSSTDKEFMSNQQNNPDDYRYNIINVFKTRSEAIGAEIYLHNLFDVAKNPMFYNRAKQKVKGFDTSGIIVSAETRAKISEANKNPSLKTRAKLSRVHKGKSLSSEQKAKISEIHKGKPKSAETRAKISETYKNRPVISCPYCNKSGRSSAMYRWHFDKCKQKISSFSLL